VNDSVDQQRSSTESRRATGCDFYGGYRLSQGPDLVRAKLEEPVPYTKHFYLLTIDIATK
jgi:hypothetical protein